MKPALCSQTGQSSGIRFADRHSISNSHGGNHVGVANSVRTEITEVGMFIVRKTHVIIVALFVAGCSGSKQSPSRSENVYVITAHTVIEPKPTEFGGYTFQEDDYTVTFGIDVLKVKYAESQASTAKAGDPIGSGLHYHDITHADLSQVPQVGTPILKCVIDVEHPTYDGTPVIAVQPTPAPCMVQIGDDLKYLPAPNDKILCTTYVHFDVVSEKVRGDDADAR
jgi:hypothetical protein